MLESLESFLSTFQNDLSAVSGHISQLQGRSRLIEARLQGRRVSPYACVHTCLLIPRQHLEKSLGPTVSQLVLPPELISVIMETEPGEKWIPAITQLDSRMSAIRGGPRVAARQSLDDVAEKLRIKVSPSLI